MVVKSTVYSLVTEFGVNRTWTPRCVFTGMDPFEPGEQSGDPRFPAVCIWCAMHRYGRWTNQRWKIPLRPVTGSVFYLFLSFPAWTYLQNLKSKQITNVQRALKQSTRATNHQACLKARTHIDVRLINTRYLLIVCLCRGFPAWSPWDTRSSGSQTYESHETCSPFRASKWLANRSVYTPIRLFTRIITANCKATSNTTFHWGYHALIRPKACKDNWTCW